MRCGVRSRASAASSFSASFTASRTKSLMAFSPHGPSAPGRSRRRNPFTPAKPTPLHLAGVAVEHRHAGRFEDVAHLVLFARLEIVVAQHADHRDVDRAQLPRQDLRLLGQAVIGQVAAQQQHVRRLGRLGQQRLQLALHRLGAMQVGQGADAHHAVLPPSASVHECDPPVPLSSKRRTSRHWVCLKNTASRQRPLWLARSRRSSVCACAYDLLHIADPTRFGRRDASLLPRRART